MDPDRLRGGCEAFRDTELIFSPPIEIEILPPPEDPEPVVTPEAEISMLLHFFCFPKYRLCLLQDSDNPPVLCPLDFCEEPMRCQWYGATYDALYEHFVTEPERHVANNLVVDVKVANEPALCEWPNFATICDEDGLFGMYMVLMKKDPDMYFFFSAEVFKIKCAVCR